MENEEIWRSVPGFEGYYKISSHGRVKRIGSGRLLKPSLDTWGYPKLLLAKDGVNKPRRIHRLVALAFVENPHKKPMVNHRNGNKEDNRASNLEWSTAKENNMHAIETGLRKTKRLRDSSNHGAVQS